MACFVPSCLLDDGLSSVLCDGSWLIYLKRLCASQLLTLVCHIIHGYVKVQDLPKGLDAMYFHLAMANY